MTDAHIHLQSPRFDADRFELLRRAKAAGVQSFLCAATTPEDSLNVLTLAQEDASVLPFIGTHPWYAEQYDATAFEALLKQNPEAGVGEIGLDNVRKADNQAFAFQDQLEKAAAYARPCVIHCVKAFDQIAVLLKAMKKHPPALLFHGFSGTKEQAEFLRRYEAYFSFSGTILRPEKAKNRAVFTALPADRILIETDAPDGSIERNIPENLALIAPQLAALRHTQPTDFITEIRRNAERFTASLR